MGLGAGGFGSGPDRFRIFWWPGPVAPQAGLGWAGAGVGAGGAVYISQDEPAAMTKVLRRGPRESGALAASERFCGQLALSVAGPHPRTSCRTNPSA